MNPLLLASAAHNTAQLPGYIPWVFGAVLVTVLLVMALELIEKTIVAMLAAGICLFLGFALNVLPWPTGTGHVLPFYVTVIEWSTIGVIIGTSIFVEVASRSGIFTWSAIKLVKFSQGDPLRLLVFYSILTVLFSAFLNNVTAMIVIGSLTVVSCRRLEISSVPYLITEGILTNIGGLLTLISSLPNIIVGKAADIKYVDFFLLAAPIAIVLLVVSILIARRMYRTEIPTLKDDAERERARNKVDEFDEWETVKDMKFFYFSWGALAVVIMAFIVQSYIPILKVLGLEFVALGAGTGMLVARPQKVEETIEKIEWSLVFFFVGLFTILGVMEKAGVLDAIGSLIGGLLALGQTWGSVCVMWLAALFSGFTDNIPLAAMLTKVFEGMQASGEPISQQLWWAIILGCGLGGNVTPIGSASTVVALTLLKKQNVKLSFVGFMKIGGLFVAAQLLLATLYLVLMAVLKQGFVLWAWVGLLALALLATAYLLTFGRGQKTAQDAK